MHMTSYKNSPHICLLCEKYPRLIWIIIANRGSRGFADFSFYTAYTHRIDNEPKKMPNKYTKKENPTHTHTCEETHIKPHRNRSSAWACAVACAREHADLWPDVCEIRVRKAKRAQKAELKRHNDIGADARVRSCLYTRALTHSLAQFVQYYDT